MELHLIKWIVTVLPLELWYALLAYLLYTRGYGVRCPESLTVRVIWFLGCMILPIVLPCLILYDALRFRVGAALAIMIYIVTLPLSFFMLVAWSDATMNGGVIVIIGWAHWLLLPTLQIIKCMQKSDSQTG